MASKPWIRPKRTLQEPKFPGKVIGALAMLLLLSNIPYLPFDGIIGTARAENPATAGVYAGDGGFCTGNTRCVAVRLVSDTAAASHRTGWEMDPGASVTLTYRTWTSGITPPSLPTDDHANDQCDIAIRHENSGTNVRVLHSADTCPSDGATYTFYSTSNGLVGGLARAGTYRIYIYVRDALAGTGGTVWEQNSDDPTEGWKGALRGGTEITAISANAYPSGSTFAYTVAGETMTWTATMTAAHSGQVRKFNMVALDSAGNIPAGFSAVSITAAADTGSFATSSTVSDGWPATSALYGIRVTVTDNSPLTGVDWTHITAATSPVVLDSATQVHRPTFYTVDPRLTVTHLIQMNDNTFGTGPMTEDEADGKRLTSDLAFRAARFTNARGEGLNGLTASLSLVDAGALTTPIVDSSLTTATAGGELGWTDLKPWSSSLPGGSWTQTASVTAPAGADASSHLLSSTRTFTLLAPDPSIAVSVGAGDTSAPTDGWAPGKKLDIVAGLSKDSTKLAFGSATVSIVRFNPATGQPEYLSSVSPSVWSTGSTFTKWTMGASPGDANIAIKQFTTAQTADWSFQDLNIIAGLVDSSGTPYSGSMVLNVESPKGADPVQVEAHPVIANAGETMTFVVHESFLDGAARTGNAAGTQLYLYNPSGTLVLDGVNPTEIAYGAYQYTYALGTSPALGGWRLIAKTTDSLTGATNSATTAFFVETDGVATGNNNGIGQLAVANDVGIPASGTNTYAIDFVLQSAAGLKDPTSNQVDVTVTNQAGAAPAGITLAGSPAGRMTRSAAGVYTVTFTVGTTAVPGSQLRWTATWAESGVTKKATIASTLNDYDVQLGRMETALTAAQADLDALQTDTAAILAKWGSWTAATLAAEVDALEEAVGTQADSSATATLFGRIKQLKETADANDASTDSQLSTLTTNVGTVSTNLNAFRAEVGAQGQSQTAYALMQDIQSSLTTVAADVSTIKSEVQNPTYGLAAMYGYVVRQAGTAQAGATSTITLASGASSVTSTYVGATVHITGGTGAGQTRVISAYDGSTKVATVTRSWVTTPTSSSTYVVYASQDAPAVDSSLSTSLRTVDRMFGHSGTAQAGAASTITLASGASSTDDYYNGQVIKIYSGTGIDQSRIITDYVGATKVATVDRAWSTTPTSSSAYALIHVPQFFIGGGIALQTLNTQLTEVQGDTDTIIAKWGSWTAATLAAEVDGLEETIGSASDTSSASTVFGKIQSFRELHVTDDASLDSQLGTITTNLGTVSTNLNAFRAEVGAQGQGQTAYALIQSVQTTLNTVASDIVALKTLGTPQFVVPAYMEVPASGSRTYVLDLTLSNVAGFKDPDSNIVDVSVLNQAGSAPTGITLAGSPAGRMTRSAAGQYTLTVTVASTATINDELRFVAAWAESSVSKKVRGSALAADIDTQLGRLETALASIQSDTDALQVDTAAILAKWGSWSAATLAAEVDALEENLGAPADTSSASTVFGKIQSFRELHATDDASIDSQLAALTTTANSISTTLGAFRTEVGAQGQSQTAYQMLQLLDAQEDSLALSLQAARRAIQEAMDPSKALAAHWKLDDKAKPGATEIVANPGFETYTTTPGVPDSWAARAAGTGVTLAKETGIVQSGSNSVKVTVNWATASVTGHGLEQVLTGLTVGQTYYVEGWYYISALPSSGTAVTMRLIDTTQTCCVNMAVASQPGASQVAVWQKVAAAFEVKSGQTYAWQMDLFRSTAGSATDNIYFDSFTVRAIEALDSTADSQNGRLVSTGANAPAPTPGVLGRINYGYDFDGVDDYLVVQNNETLNTDSLTVSLWVKPDTLRVQGIIEKDTLVPGWSTRIFMDNTAGRIQVDTSDGTTEYGNVAGGALPTTTYSFLAVTYDKPTQTLVLYVNGVQVAQSTSVADMRWNNIGGITVAQLATNRWDGTIDDIKVYDRAMTSREVAQEYDRYDPYLRLEADIAAVQASVDAIQVDVNALQVDTAAILAKWGSWSAATLAAEVDALEENLGAPADTSSASTVFGKIQSFRELHATDDASLDSQLGTITTNLGTVSTNLNAFRAEVGAQGQGQTAYALIQSVQTALNTVASDVAAVKAYGSITFSAPAYLQIPASGSATYQLDFSMATATGAKDPDSNIVDVSALNQAGATPTGITLAGSPAGRMTRSAAGLYSLQVTVASTATINDQLRWTVSYTEGAVARKLKEASILTDADTQLNRMESALTTLQSDVTTIKTNTNTLVAKWGSLDAATLAGYVDSLETSVGLSSDASSAATLFGRIKQLKETADANDASTDSQLSTLTTNVGTVSTVLNAFRAEVGAQGQSQTAYALIQAVQTLVTTVGTDLAALRDRVDYLDQYDTLPDEVFHFRFNEGSGTTYASSVGDYTATTSGGTAIERISGREGLAPFAGRTGDDDIANIAGTSTFMLGDFSIDAWINRDAGAESGILMSENAAGSVANGISFSITSTGVLRAYVSNGTSGTFGSTLTWSGGGTTTVPTGTWTHVAFAVDRQASQIAIEAYIDGVSQGTQTTTRMYSSLTFLRIFGEDGGDNELNTRGGIDDLRAFSRTLSDEEVSYLYGGSSEVSRYLIAKQRLANIQADLDALQLDTAGILAKWGAFTAAQLAGYVDTIETNLGLPSDTSSASTVFGKIQSFRELHTADDVSLDSQLAAIQATATAASSNLDAFRAEVGAQGQSQTAYALMQSIQAALATVDANVDRIMLGIEFERSTAANLKLDLRLDELTGSDGSNLLTNPGFETYTTTPGVPDGWMNIGAGSSTFIKETITKRTGSNAVRITTGGAGDSEGLRQPLSVVAGRSYYVEVYARTSGVAGEQARLSIRNISDGASIGLGAADGTDGTTTFQKLSLTFTAVAGKSYEFWVRHVTATGAGETIYVDDALVQEIQAKDSSTYATHGTLYGGTNTAGPTIGVTGEWRTAYSFDGVDDGITVAIAGEVMQSGHEGKDWALEAWFQPTGAPAGGDQYIIGRNGFHGGIVQESANSGRDIQCQLYDTANAVFQAVTYTLPNTAFHHIAMVYDNRVVTCYVDGVSRGTFTFAGNGLFPTSYGTNMYIGGAAGTSYHAKGVIDGARAYDRALTAREVAIRYDQFNNFVRIESQLAALQTSVNSLQADVDLLQVDTAAILAKWGSWSAATLAAEVDGLEESVGTSADAGSAATLFGRIKQLNELTTANDIATQTAVANLQTTANTISTNMNAFRAEVGAQGQSQTAYALMQSIQTALVATAADVSTIKSAVEHPQYGLSAMYGMLVRNAGTAQAGSAATITLAAAASSTTDTYDGAVIYLTGGTGIGQTRAITSYAGSTRIATVSRNWITNPDATTTYVVYASQDAPAVDSSQAITLRAVDRMFGNSGTAQGGSSTTITLSSSASSLNDYYAGQVVKIYSSTGSDQARIITAYNGATKVATVDKPWVTSPTSSSVYALILVPQLFIGDSMALVTINGQLTALQADVDLLQVDTAAILAKWSSWSAATLAAEVDGLEENLGTPTDASSASTVFGKIQSFRELHAADDASLDSQLSSIQSTANAISSLLTELHTELGAHGKSRTAFAIMEDIEEAIAALDAEVGSGGVETRALIRDFWVDYNATEAVNLEALLDRMDALELANEQRFNDYMATFAAYWIDFNSTLASQLAAILAFQDTFIDTMVEHDATTAAFWADLNATLSDANTDRQAKLDSVMQAIQNSSTAMQSAFDAHHDEMLLQHEASGQEMAEHDARMLAQFNTTRAALAENFTELRGFLSDEHLNQTDLVRDFWSAENATWLAWYNYYDTTTNATGGSLREFLNEQHNQTRNLTNFTHETYYNKYGIAVQQFSTAIIGGLGEEILTNRRIIEDGNQASTASLIWQGLIVDIIKGVVFGLVGILIINLFTSAGIRKALRTWTPFTRAYDERQGVRRAAASAKAAKVRRPRHERGGSGGGASNWRPSDE